MSWRVVNDTSVELPDEAATLAFAARFADVLQSRFAGTASVFLEGPLGAGKTTLVRGILRRFGFQGAVKSPTYTLLEPYTLEGCVVYHFDLYRVADPRELEFVGVDEIVEAPGYKLFEWPQRAGDWLPAADVQVQLQVIPPGRLAHVTGLPSELWAP